MLLQNLATSAGFFRIEKFGHPNFFNTSRVGGFPLVNRRRELNNTASIIDGLWIACRMANPQNFDGVRLETIDDDERQGSNDYLPCVIISSGEPSALRKGLQLRECLHKPPVYVSRTLRAFRSYIFEYLGEILQRRSGKTKVHKIYDWNLANNIATSSSLAKSPASAAAMPSSIA